MPESTPRRDVWCVTERQTENGPRSFWTKIGTASDNKDGSITGLAPQEPKMTTKHKYEKIDASQIPAKVRFDVPKRNQGQV